MAIIMICSQLPQQGKDTATQFFVENYNGVRVAFADNVKRIAKDLGWNGVKDEKGRQLLIDVGCTARKYNPDTWVNLAITQIGYNYIIGNKNSIISDLRFVNEVTRIKEIDKDAIVIGIESNKLGDKRFEFDESQVEYKDIEKDFIIENNGTLEEFYAKLNDILKQIKGE